jgi:hypothetical protein
MLHMGPQMDSPSGYSLGITVVCLCSNKLVIPTALVLISLFPRGQGPEVYLQNRKYYVNYRYLFSVCLLLDGVFLPANELKCSEVGQVPVL